MEYFKLFAATIIIILFVAFGFSLISASCFLAINYLLPYHWSLAATLVLGVVFYVISGVTKALQTVFEED